MRSGHGDDAYRYAGPIRANFSSNVRPATRLPELREHLMRGFDCVAHYPEPTAETLTRQLADRLALEAREVVVTPGATAAIYLVAWLHRGRPCAVVSPTFAEYADASRLHGSDVRRISRADFKAGRLGAAEVIWVCNPNNPDGAVFSRAELLAFAAAHPDRRLVVDIAYARQCAEPPLLASDVRTNPNLIVIDSLSKAAGVPGLRLGYLATHATHAASLADAQPPWAVGALEQAAAKWLLESAPATDAASSGLPDRRCHLLGDIDVGVYLAEARRFAAVLGAIPGIAVQSSATGFFLIEVARGTAAELKAYLLAQHGLLIRDASNFNGLTPRHARISTQTAEQNRWLEEAITAWTRL